MKDRPESESFRFWLIFMSILPGEFFIDVFSLSIVYCPVFICLLEWLILSGHLRPSRPAWRGEQRTIRTKPWSILSRRSGAIHS